MKMLCFSCMLEEVTEHPVKEGEKCALIVPLSVWEHIIQVCFCGCPAPAEYSSSETNSISVQLNILFLLV